MINSSLSLGSFCLYVRRIFQEANIITADTHMHVCVSRGKEC